MKDIELKGQVREFWNKESCGEVYAGQSTGHSDQDKLDYAYYEKQRQTRYLLEPYISSFARFGDGHAKDVLEIGVGMGADHVEWARSGPSRLVGIDLTDRAVGHTKRRLSLLGLRSQLEVADAEALPFESGSFDIVYSWGVLHHSPNTGRAINEVYRVLRPGGVARIMIYHRYSITGYLLWLRYALLRGQPFTSLDTIYARYLESPGTKAYSRDEAYHLFRDYANVEIKPQLSVGDLLEGAAGQRHQGIALTVARKIWPRRLLRRIAPNHGLFLLIEAVK